MSDTAATLAHQLALVKAQLKEKTEESSAFQLKLAASELVVQQLRGRRQLPVPAAVSALHDKPTASAAGNELATPAEDEPAAALLPHTGTKPTPLPLPSADNAAPGMENRSGVAPGSERRDHRAPLPGIHRQSSRASVTALNMIKSPDATANSIPRVGVHSTTSFLRTTGPSSSSLLRMPRSRDVIVTMGQNAPLLFPLQKHASRKKKTPNAKGKHFIRDSRRSSFAIPPAETMMKTRYPMFVLPVKVLLRLERLLPHQDMLKRGLLLPYNQFSMKGRIMFISHQCTSRLLCALYPVTHTHTHTHTHRTCALPLW